MSWFRVYLVMVAVSVGAIFVTIEGGQMLVTFLAGTVAFWIIVALSFILMAYWLDDDESHGVLTTIAFIATIVLLSFVNKGPVHSFVQNMHISKLLSTIGLYIVIGIAWSFIKWYFFLLKKRDEILEKQERSRTMTGVRGSTVSPVPTKSATIDASDIPSAKENKSKIILWMSYWPWSALWTMLNDPIRRFFNMIYRRISKLYQKISDRVFRDLVKTK